MYRLYTRLFSSLVTTAASLCFAAFGWHYPCGRGRVNCTNG